MAPYVTKQTLAKRYNTTPRTIERMWNDGRLPPPKFPIGPHKPLGDLEEIEAHERAAISRPRRRKQPDQSDRAA
jgi:hypothetical protein